MTDNVRNIGEKQTDDRPVADEDFVMVQLQELTKANAQLSEKVAATKMVDPTVLAIQVRIEMLIDLLISKESRVQFEYQFQANWHQAMQNILSQINRHELTKGITH